MFILWLPEDLRHPLESLFIVTWLLMSLHVCQLPLMEDAALLPEDRDVAEERKRVLECQPIIESMVGSPLVLQELSKVCRVFSLFE